MVFEEFSKERLEIESLRDDNESLREENDFLRDEYANLKKENEFMKKELLIFKSKEDKIKMSFFEELAKRDDIIKCLSFSKTTFVSALITDFVFIFIFIFQKYNIFCFLTSYINNSKMYLISN